MPTVATVLFAWLATSALLSPLVGMALAVCTREPAAGAHRLAPARAGA